MLTDFIVGLDSRVSGMERSQMDQIYSVEAWAESRGMTIEIHAKYLNYDVSDGLKADLRDLVRKQLTAGVHHFVLDLSRVSIVDSCGVGLMIGLHNLVREQSGTLYLTGMTHFLEKIFRMMHLDQYFNIVESEERAREMVIAPV